MVAKRIQNIEYAIRDVAVKAKELEKKGKNMLYLNIGDPNMYDFGAPIEIRKAYANAIMEGYDYYGDSQGDEELREELSKLEKVGKEDIIVTAGTSEGLIFLMGALAESGKNILLPSPCYPPYSSLVDFYGGEKRFYPCDENWIPITEDLEKQVDKNTCAIILVNPNNPTGAVYDGKIMKEISNIAAQNKVPLISDEIYSDLILDEDVKMGKIDPDVPHILASGFSKIHLCTGYRIGYLIFKGFPEIRDSVMKLCRLRLSINTPAQRGALAALHIGKKHIEESRKKMKRRRDLCLKLLGEIKDVECIRPKAAFYAFPKVNSSKWKDDMEFTYKLMEETGVVVVNGSGFSPILDGKYFRIVYLPPEKILESAVSKIKDFIEK